MYFISNIQDLGASKIHRVVKYFASPLMKVVMVKRSFMSSAMLKLILPNGMISVSIPLQDHKEREWAPYFNPALTSCETELGRVSTTSGEFSLSLSVIMTCQGATCPTLQLARSGAVVASIDIDFEEHSDLCGTFAAHDATPLMYTLYHIQHGRETWELRCFDKANAPLRLLSKPSANAMPPKEWAVKEIPFPDYFTDEALHNNPYSKWGQINSSESAEACS